MKLVITFSLFILSFSLTRSDEYVWQNLKTEYRDVCILDSSTVFIIGCDGLIKKSTDGGDTYKRIESFLRCELLCIDVFNKNYIMIGSENGDIVTSKDGGKVLKKARPFETQINDVQICDSLCAYICCGNGKIYKSIDFGENWSCIFSEEGNEPVKLKFIDNETGFCFLSILSR